MSEPMLMVCVGMRLSSRDKLIQGWREIVNDEPQEPTRFWSKPLAKHAGPGSVYQFMVDRDDDDEHMSVHTGGKQAPRFIEAWPQRADVLEWQALDSEAREFVADQRAAKRVKDDDLIAAEVLRLRKLVWRSNDHRVRSALIRAIDSELWRPLTKQEKEDDE